MKDDSFWFGLMMAQKNSGKEPKNQIRKEQKSFFERSIIIKEQRPWYEEASRSVKKRRKKYHLNLKEFQNEKIFYQKGNQLRWRDRYRPQEGIYTEDYQLEEEFLEAIRKNREKSWPVKRIELLFWTTQV